MKPSLIKTFIILLLLPLFVTAFVGCGSSVGSSDLSGNSDSSSNTFKPFDDKIPAYTFGNSLKEVPKAEMPTAQSGTLSKSEVLDLYRPYTNWRIYQIRAARPDTSRDDGGISYYMSNNGSFKGNGLSPETAFCDLSQLDSVGLKAGDIVYFECGSIWRETVNCTVDGVTYTSYGEGEKPKFYSYHESASGDGKWIKTDKKNVYKFYSNIGKDVGNIVFGGGEKHGIKAVVGDGVNYTTGKKFKSYGDLKENFHFWHNDGELYLYCDRGNPSDLFSDIEIAIKSHGFSVEADNVTIDGLDIRYCGAHGVGGNRNKGLKVKNCEFYWIGGSTHSGSTRYGNGVEIWGSAIDFTVDNCYFYQIYDAAITFQFVNADATDPEIMKNIRFSNNVVEYANYSIEYFSGNWDATKYYIENAVFEDNLLWYAGEGFCSQRADKTQDAHIKSWQHCNIFNDSLIIRNNLFAFANNVLVETMSTKSSVLPTYSSNIYIQNGGGNLGHNGDGKAPKVEFSEDNVKSVLDDTNATVITVK